MWLSPWWLMYVDTVWMRYCADFGYDKRTPAAEPRDWAITYRDGNLWKNLYGDRVQFPVSAIMTIGIIDGKLRPLGGEDEPLDRWANNVVVNMGRGSMLQELYITPDRLSDEQWDILASALKWQRRFLPQMASGRMLPTDPSWGDVYGWVHMDRTGGFVCLRNPGLVGRTATVALPELDTGTDYHAVRSYPWREAVELEREGETWAVRTELEPYGVTVIEVTAGDPMEPVMAGARTSVVERTEGGVVYDMWGRPGTEAAVRIGGDSGSRETMVSFPGEPYRLWQVESVGDEGRSFRVIVDEGVEWELVVVAAGLPKAEGVRLLVDGQDVEAAQVPGDGWVMYRRPLPDGEHVVGWEPVSATEEPQPFSTGGFGAQTFFVREAELASVRLRVACEGESPPALETPRAHIERSTWVGPKVSVTPERGPMVESITEADLARAKAAKLHINVFGSQGGDDYGRKWVVLNGERVARVPVNSNAQRPDAWEEFVVDLEPAQMELLRLENVVRIETETIDNFKLAELALAVQHPDGRWVESGHDGTVWCTPAGWVFQEGSIFTGRTPEVTLRFRSP